MVEVKEVTTKRDLKKFIKFKLKLYKDNPYGVPEVIADDLSTLDRKKNPAFIYSEAKYFLAYRDGEIAGRVVAIISHKANEKWNTRKIRFWMLDFIDDLEVSKALLDRVAQWGKEKGLDEIHGPLGFTDLDKEGMLVEGFEEQDMFITIYNYPYYPEHMEKLGFKKDVDWIEYRVPVPREETEQIKQLDQMKDIVLKRNHLRIVPLKSMKDVKPYLPKVFDMIDEEYSHLYGTVPLIQEQRDWYYNSFINFLNTQYLCLIVDKDDNLAALGVSVPSLGQAVRKHRGRLFPFGIFSMLRALKKNDTLELFLIAVRKDLQSKGIPAVLFNEVAKSARKNGIRFAETGPELETNVKVNSLWKNYNARQHRRRRCYAKKID
ncbi:MAG: N-acetyltransferase [Christensenellales bacterium]